MSREWTTGDVAMLPSGKIAVVDEGGNLVYGRGKYESARPSSINANAARPLVVIDPEDAGQVAALRILYYDHMRAMTANSPTLNQDAMQAAFREYADPTPPKPDEPMGLGAVVEDADGLRWVNTGPDKYPWESDSRTNRDWRNYESITAVRVLSHGVTEGEL